MKKTRRFITTLAVVMALIMLFTVTAGAYSTVRNGSSGSDVRTLQTMLNSVDKAGLSVDGQFGPKTLAAVRKFQAANGLSVDGIVGPLTWGKLTAKYSPSSSPAPAPATASAASSSHSTVRSGSRGSDVRTLQTMLNAIDKAGLVVDGDFGPKTLAAVRKFQAANGLSVDGIVGPLTWAKLDAKYAAPASTGSTPKPASGKISELAEPSWLQFDANGAPTRYTKVIEGSATAYNGGSRTATGLVPKPGYVAVDPKKIPYGTKLYIVSTDGRYVYGYAEAQDTGGFINSGNTVVDLYFNTYNEAIQFGRRNVKIYVLE